MRVLRVTLKSVADKLPTGRGNTPNKLLTDRGNAGTGGKFENFKPPIEHN